MQFKPRTRLRNLFSSAAAVSRFCMLGLWLTAPGPRVAAQHVPIRSLTFEGNRMVETGRLLSRLRASREGGWYSPDTLARELQNLEKFYQDQGFLQAKIGPPLVEFQPDPANVQAAAIRVPVFEGPLFTVGRVTVKNARVFSPETLLQMCPLQAGQPYSRLKMEEWRDKIEEGYHTMGYVRFRSTVHEDINESLKTVDPTLECSEGDAYSVGKITVEGDASINPSDVKRHLLVGEGGLFNPEMLSLSLQFLNRMGVFRPISDSDVDVKIDDVRKTVDLVFRLILIQKPGTKSPSGSPDRK